MHLHQPWEWKRNSGAVHFTTQSSTVSTMQTGTEQTEGLADLGGRDRSTRSAFSQSIDLFLARKCMSKASTQTKVVVTLCLLQKGSRIVLEMLNSLFICLPPCWWASMFTKVHWDRTMVVSGWLVQLMQRSYLSIFQNWWYGILKVLHRMWKQKPMIS